MSEVTELAGHRYGRWLVKDYAHKRGKTHYWNCICDCGTERIVQGGDMRRGGSLSCGCLAKEIRAARKSTHGMSGQNNDTSNKHPAYTSWQGAHQRCGNPNNDGYSIYGGRGIRVCERWKDFGLFWQDMGGTWAKGLSLDRIDYNGDYEPGNCRWATPKEQANNRVTNTLINTPHGPLNITQASEAFGISPITIRSRIRYGWPDDKLLIPVTK